MTPPPLPTREEWVELGKLLREMRRTIDHLGRTGVDASTGPVVGSLRDVVGSAWLAWQEIERRGRDGGGR